jgi:tetratricopeptide (TPR) repeat protein
MKLRLAFLLAILLVASAAWAQNDGGTESPFALGVGSRELSLGGANMAQSDPTSAIVWNSSRLASAQRLSLSAFHSQLFESGVNYTYAGFVYPTLDNGTFGVGIVRHGVSGIDKRDAGNLSLGEIQLTQLRLYAAYGRHVSGYDVGVSVSIDYQSLDTYSAASSPGINLAVSRTFELPYDVLPQLTFALNAINLLQPGVRLVDESYQYPRSLAAGLSVNMVPGSRLRHQLTLSTSVKAVEHISTQFHLGIEYSLMQMVHMRGGLNQSHPAVGAGVTYRGFDFDYALVDRDLGSIHMFTLTTGFGLSATERRAQRAERREQEFKQQMHDRFLEQNRALMAKLLDEGDQYIADGELSLAVTSYEGALLLARSTKSDTVTVRILLDGTRQQMEESARLARYSARMDSANLAWTASDYLTARYFANLALADSTTSQPAALLVANADKKLAGSDEKSRLIAHQLIKLDSLVSQGRFEEAEGVVAHLVEVAPEEEQTRLAAIQLEMVRWRRALDQEQANRDEEIVPVPTPVVTTTVDTTAEGRIDTSASAPVAEALSSEMRKEVEQHYIRAQTAFSNGDLDLAIKHWEQVEKLAPDYESARQFLVRAYKFVGVELYAQKRRDEAVTVWKKASRLAPDDLEVRDYIDHTEVEIQKLKKLSYDER